MIYEAALKSNLNDVKAKLDCYVNHVTGVACIKSSIVDGLSKDEDGTVNIVYAIVSGQPMTIIERIDASDYEQSELDEILQGFNDLDCGYSASYAVKSGYYDIMVVGSRILEAARHM